MTPETMARIEREQKAYLDTMFNRMDNASPKDIERFKTCMNNRMASFEAKVRIFDDANYSDDEFLEVLIQQIEGEEFSATMTIFGD